MKKFTSLLTAALFILCFSSCQAIGDIFKAGVWVGVLIVLGVLALIIYLITKSSNKG
jgi:TRAP-type C4-dicarboxylate transport system permease large subunit